jgi:hypothetical protein
MKKRRPDISHLADEMGAVAAFAQSGPSGRNHFASKEVRGQTSKPANMQADEDANSLADEPVSLQASKIVKKHGTYLTPDSIKRLKLIAVEENRKDYEVLQEAVDQYLKSRGGDG